MSDSVCDNYLPPAARLSAGVPPPGRGCWRQREDGGAGGSGQDSGWSPGAGPSRPGLHPDWTGQGVLLTSFLLTVAMMIRHFQLFNCVRLQI